MTDRNASCDERIAEHLRSRLDHITGLNELGQVVDGDDVTELSEQARNVAAEHEIPLDAQSVSNDGTREAAYQATSELPLSVETRRVVRIDLSTGGPADWIEVQLDSDDDPVRAEYHFADWFDHASRPLEGDDEAAAFDFARHLTADFYFPSESESRY